MTPAKRTANRRYEQSEHGQAVHHAAALRRRIRLKEWLDQVKNQPCKDCGRQFPPVCMDFDHVRGEKRDEIAHLTSRRAVEIEIAKCDLVCANCHRIRTEKRRSVS